jgi:prepilin-type N-terminal cleavage/methylation domain-containing protein
MQHFFLNHFKKKISTRGFTLIELLLVIAIFGIMSSVAIFNFRGFSGNSLVDNLAYDIALSIREAQTAGGAAYSRDNVVAEIDPSRPIGISGIRFIVNTDGGIDSFQMLELSELTLANFDFENFSPSSIDWQINDIRTVTDERVEISGIELNDSSYSRNEDIIIYFLRPFPEAYICTVSGALTSTSYDCGYQEIKFFIEGTNAARERSVFVNQVGFISVEDVVQ